MIFLIFEHETTLTDIEDVRREVCAELFKFWAMDTLPVGMGLLLAKKGKNKWTVTCERLCDATPEYINPAIARLFGD